MSSAVHLEMLLSRVRRRLLRFFPLNTEGKGFSLTAVSEDRARGFYLRLRLLERRAQEADPGLLHRRVARPELQRLGTIPGKVQLEPFLACTYESKAIASLAK